MFNFAKKEKKEPENLKEVLIQLKKVEEKLEAVSKELENLKKKNKFSIQKVGFLRYNPFKEVGGNQSFSFALLDDNDNGIVVSSLYSREGNRIYGKSITKGQSEFTLSKEEEKVINEAKGL